MNTPKRINHLGLLTLVLAALVTAGCGGANGADGSSAEATDEDGPARRSIRIEALVLKPDTFEDVIELTGTVESVNDATLSAQSAGTVEVLTPLGRRVGQGTVVARLNQGLVRAGFQQAEAQVEAALAHLEWDEYNHTRQERLFQDSIISALEFQTVQTQLNRARASLRQAEAFQAQAQEQINNTIIRAPFSGVVEEHAVERGEQVSPGMPVLRIVDTRRVKVYVGVPERYAGDIEVGTQVMLDFKAYRGKTLHATLSAETMGTVEFLTPLGQRVGQDAVELWVSRQERSHLALGGDPPDRVGAGEGVADRHLGRGAAGGDQDQDAVVRRAGEREGELGQRSLGVGDVSFAAPDCSVPPN